MGLLILPASLGGCKMLNPFPRYVRNAQCMPYDDDHGDDGKDGARMKRLVHQSSTNQQKVLRRLRPYSFSTNHQGVLKPHPFHPHSPTPQPPSALSQRPSPLPLWFFSDKGFPVGGRALWREQTSGFTQKWPFLNASPGTQLSHL